jgi:spore germination protein KC
LPRRSSFHLRDQELRQTPYLFVVRGENPEQIFRASTGFSSNLGSYIEGLSDSNRKANSTGVFVKTLDFMKTYYEDGKEPVMGVLQIEPNKAAQMQAGQSGGGSQGQEQSTKEYVINCTGLAAFKGEKLVGFMNGTESRAYNIVINKARSAFIPVVYGGGDTVIEIINSKARIKTSFEDDTPSVDIRVQMNINIAQETGTKNLRKNETYETVEKSFDRQMEEQIKAAISKAQTEFDSDIFGFGTYMHQQNPKVWSKIRGNWGQYFSKCKVTVTVASAVKRIGEIKQPFKLEE